MLRENSQSAGQFDVSWSNAFGDISSFSYLPCLTTTKAHSPFKGLEAENTTQR